MKKLHVIVKNEPLRKTTKQKEKMDTSPDNCRIMQGRSGRDGTPCSCVATYGTAGVSFYP